MDWSNIKYFKSHEFDSPDLKGSGEQMKQSTVEMLDCARSYCKEKFGNIPFIINSGIRSPKHNKKIGGVIDSSHLYGWAADIQTKNSRERFAITASLIYAGFTRIGKGSGFIHADNDPSKTPNVEWLYKKHNLLISLFLTQHDR